MKVKNLVKPYMIWSMILIILPLVMIALYSVVTKDDSLLSFNFTLDNFIKIGDPVYVKVIVKSLAVGALVTLICLVISYPLALFITRTSEKTGSILILFLTIPMLINTLLRTYAWISLLSEHGIINAALKSIGIARQNMIYNNFSVMIGLVCDLLPFMVIPIHTAMAKMDVNLIDAAYDLGANKLQVITRVIFKMSLPGVISGCISVFIFSISEFVVPELLGGHQFVLIGNLIENQFISIGDWNFGSALGILLVVLIIALAIVLRKTDRGDNND